MNVKNRFLKYVKIHSVSAEGPTQNPTTPIQFDMAKAVAQDMREIGLSDVTVTENCYVYGWLPATPGCEEKPALGLIAHMDTAPDFCGENVNPQIHENYDGKDIELGAGRTLSVKQFSDLPLLKGKTLITTDGSTLLGSDDKAGIVEILACVETLMAEKLPHGRLCIGFTPDEEVGLGPQGFDIPLFGATWAYTVDGGSINEVECENFNAASAKVSIHGFNIHPGSAKDIMVNAALLAMEFNAMLPAGDIPAHTAGYEGFYHLGHMSGDVEKAELSYIIRDHDAALFEGRKAEMTHIAALMNEKYGEGTVILTMKEQYRNMLEKVRPAYHLVENAQKAIEKEGLTFCINPIRGGTDGAQLSYRGLPCPNLGTGGYAGHGPYEHITVEDMEQMVHILVDIVVSYGK